MSSVSFAQISKPKPSIQGALQQFDFIQEQIINGPDTITYFLKKNDHNPRNLVVFIQGTDPNPIFSYKINEGKTTYFRWFNDDYKSLDSTYTFAIIPKPGMSGLYEEGNITVPQFYHDYNYLDYRIHQIDQSINHIIENHLKNPQNIVVYGHSEGAAIGAALANVNDRITHLGFWSGNVLHNFFEFSLFNRLEALQGKLSDEEAHKNIMGIMEWYKAVLNDPNSTELDHFSYTNKRWSTYEKPPIDYLLELEIPIFALFATEDESTPIETAYLLPFRFLEQRKDNLTFEVCMHCDHSYFETKEDEKMNHWKDWFARFMEWVQKKK